MKTKTKHKQVKVEYLDGEMIDVDEGIAPLLEGMWQLRIATYMSCQYEPESRNMVRSDDKTKGPRIWIAFDEGGRAICKFLKAVADHVEDDPSLPAHKRIYSCMNTQYWYPDSWRYGTIITDYSHNLIDKNGSEIDAVPTRFADYGINPWVRFPVKHYPAVLAAIVKAVATQEARQNEIRRVIDSVEIHTG